MAITTAFLESMHRNILRVFPQWATSWRKEYSEWTYEELVVAIDKLAELRDAHDPIHREVLHRQARLCAHTLHELARKETT
jgi:hypothetical protein